LAFSDDLDNEWKSSVGFAHEKHIGLFCFRAMDKVSWFSWAKPTLRLRRVFYSNS